MTQLIEAYQCDDFFDDPNTVFLDGTWALPADEGSLAKGYIPNARLFDLGKLKEATPLGAPFHPADIVRVMLVDAGIQADTHVIVYDRLGLFSAPRVWWTLKSVGHVKVSILNGGLPAFLDGGGRSASTPASPKPTPYETRSSRVQAVTLEDVVALLGTSMQIIDARPQARFTGLSPEPREGLRSGHIPGSINLPYGSLLDERKCIAADAAEKIKAAGIDLERPIITTCGSGVTAAGLAFIFDIVGAKDVYVYSGSWAEYGASDAPIETG